MSAANFQFAIANIVVEPSLVKLKNSLALPTEHARSGRTTHHFSATLESQPHTIVHTRVCLKSNSMPRDANQGYHQSLREKLDTGVAEAMPLSLEGKLEVADHELAAAAYAIRGKQMCQEPFLCFLGLPWGRRVLSRPRRATIFDDHFSSPSGQPRFTLFPIALSSDSLCGSLT